jgi:hypothetical protein
MDRAFYTMQAPNQISLSKVRFFFNQATDQLKPTLIDSVLLPLQYLQLCYYLNILLFQSLQQMSLFDAEIDGSSPLVHGWLSHEGNPDELHFFPSGSRGIDANSTFG